MITATDPCIYVCMLAENISKSKRKHVKCKNTNAHTGILFSMGNKRNDSWKRESNLRLNPCHMHVAYLICRTTDIRYNQATNKVR